MYYELWIMHYKLNKSLRYPHGPRRINTLITKPKQLWKKQLFAYLYLFDYNEVSFVLMWEGKFKEMQSGYEITYKGRIVMRKDVFSLVFT